MDEVGQKERVTQNKVIKFFTDSLGYDYLGDWHNRENSNIEVKYLTEFLKRQNYSYQLIEKAIDKFSKTAKLTGKDLYNANKNVYSLLRYGVKVKPEIGQNHETIWLIDWKNPTNNHFAIAEEVSIANNEKTTNRPDLVIYVNGIALGVIELKRSTVSVAEGIRQNIGNQQEEFIAGFFSTMQWVMAGNETEGLRYGTIETPEKYYLQWKEESEQENKLLKALSQLCSKQRFLEIIHDFVVFDKGTKKLCRHNQYFAVKAAQERIKQKEGGIIWHTQGSGKSLTMVWLAKWIRENITDARVLLITDRQELDEQIEQVFYGVNEEIHRTQNGKDLIDVLDAKTPSLICSLVHKFGNKNSDSDDLTQELTQNLPSNFSAKGNIFVFVDECHRTQSGKLHQAMKQILPNALFIGFTGTPLLKKDKQKSVEVFGTYIHTYKFDQAVKDKVVLDLIYEARDVQQNLASPEKVDQWFNAKTLGLTDIAKEKLQKKWATMKKILSSKDRLYRIVADITMDFTLKDRLNNGTGNAILVCDSIYQACRYYNLFMQQGFEKCAIITSYEPNYKDIKGEFTGEDGYTEKQEIHRTYTNMLKDKHPADFEKEVKEKFIKEPAQMKLLIVVDKLLTGFDAPPATYLYIDKQMRDHSLFQAICRVNRLDGESKEYGYIVDYKDLFKNLEKSIKDYTQEAFSEYDSDDVKGLLNNRLDTAKKRLEDARETIKALCEPVALPRESIDFQRYFCGNAEDGANLNATEQLRLKLYKYTAALIRAYANIANDMKGAGYVEAEIGTIKTEVKFYTNLKDEIARASGDYIDLKRFEPGMRHLIDNYIIANHSKTIFASEDKTLMELIVNNGVDNAVATLPENINKNEEAVAETITNNLAKTINTEHPNNPTHFEKMSTQLYELLSDLKNKKIEYRDYLAKIDDLANQLHKPKGYPDQINSPAKRALYDFFGKDTELALSIDRVVNENKKADFRGNLQKEKELKKAIENELPKGYDIDKLFEIVKAQNEY